MKRALRTLSLVALVAALSLTASKAHAQFPPFVPQQPIVINNPFYPQQTVIQPSALQPGAQVAIPGTQNSFQNYVPGVGWVSGNQYLGLDGKLHGNTTVFRPDGSSQTNFYGRNPNAAGRPGQASQYRPQGYGPRYR